MKTEKDKVKIAQLAKDFGIAENIVECIWDLGQSRGWENGYKQGCVDNSQMDTLDDEGVQQTL